MEKKPLLILLLLLTLIVIVGRYSLKEQEKIQLPRHEDKDLYLYVAHEPLHSTNEVLGTKQEKVAETSNFSDKTTDLYDYQELIKQYDWNYEVAMAVMREESGYNPRAHNPEGHNGCNGSFGLFQIACVHIGKYGVEHYTDLYDPETNVRVAHEIWKESSWRAWGVCHIQNGVRKVRCWL